MRILYVIVVLTFVWIVVVLIWSLSHKHASECVPSFDRRGHLCGRRMRAMMQVRQTLCA